jgi:hypothetical protein
MKKKTYVYIFFLRTESLMEMLGPGLQSIGMRNYRCFNLTRGFFFYFCQSGVSGSELKRGARQVHTEPDVSGGHEFLPIFEVCGNKI